MENALYQVRLNNITAGVEVSPDGVLINTAPVFAKFIGTRLDKFRQWVLGKGGRVVEINRQGRWSR